MSSALATASAGRTLTGRQKAAVLCLSLGPEYSMRLTQNLTPSEAEMISAEMQRMGRVDPDVAEAVLAGWAEMTVASDAVSAGGMDYARTVLQQALGPQKADAILKRLARQMSEAGGIVAGMGFVVELTFLNGRRKLAGYDVFSLLQYDK